MSENANWGRITSFSLRGKRLGEKYARTMEAHGAFYTLDFVPGTGVATVAQDFEVDFAEIFGRVAPLIVEVGPGSGEQLVDAASRHPENDYLALEAWGPGVARCVHAAARAQVTNVRIAELDAMQALPILFPQNSQVMAHEIWTFFPDPWRKKRHRKRRLVSPRFASVVAGALRTGGVWRMATDWDNYAWQMRDVVQESPWFDNPYTGQNIDEADGGVYRNEGGFAPRFEERIVTRFESRGHEAQRSVHDVVARRNELALGEAAIPDDPWIAAVRRGEEVPADEGGQRPPSSRRGWQEQQRNSGEEGELHG